MRLALKANPIKEILLDYNVYYGRNYTSRFASRTEIDNLLSETAQIGVAFGKNIFWDIILEHNHVSSSSEKTDVLLLDSQLKWIGSRVEVGLRTRIICWACRSITASSAYPTLPSSTAIVYVLVRCS